MWEKREATNQCGCASIKLYKDTEIWITYNFHKYELLSFKFFQPFNNMFKNILTSQVAQKGAGASVVGTLNHQPARWGQRQKGLPLGCRWHVRKSSQTHYQSLLQSALLLDCPPHNTQQKHFCGNAVSPVMSYHYAVHTHHAQATAIQGQNSQKHQLKANIPGKTATFLAWDLGNHALS